MTDHPYTFKFCLQILISLVLCTSCSNQGQYTGDGRFDDFDFLATERYILDLGQINLLSQETYVFTLSGLPNEEFIIGLEIIGSSQEERHILDTKSINPLIQIVLTDESGKLVIKRKEYLKDWVWSGALNNNSRSFVYYRGERIEDSNPIQRTGFLTDGGWGTYFTPQKNTLYKLRLEIIEADTGSRPYTVTLKAKGGGWK